MARPPRQPWLIPLLSSAGAGVSAYLSYEHWAGSEAFCFGTTGCEVVEASPYAEVLGLPVALLGLAMYALLFAVSTGYALSQSPLSPWLVLAIFGMALAGFLFSAYLTYLQLFVLYAVCLWCATSAVLMAVIFALSLRQLHLWLS